NGVRATGIIWGRNTMADGEGDPGVFTATALPGDPRLLPTVTNAFLGTRVFRDILHAAGVYSGAAGDTHRADVPSPLGLRMAAPGARSPAQSFTLNTWTGEQGAGTSPGGSAEPRLFLLLRLHPSIGMEKAPSFHPVEGVFEGWSWREHLDAPASQSRRAAPQDTWMFPNILLLHPEAARAILRYRIRTLEGARRNAREQGYEGAKFPWESAATGREVCPEEIYGAQEIHITGDVLMAFEQYYCTTQDQKLFQEDGGWELVEAVAQYWCSRMVWSEEEQLYHIRGVMPPDEYHSQVDNSAYTNAVAQRSLNFATDLARDLLLLAPEEWEDRARKIKVPFDEERKYHPEYDGYSPGEPVKQADVVLLGFPLMHPMSAEVRRNDLEMYEPVTDPAGPAMTWSMFAVGWLELKELQRAWSQLEKCFSNITEPFKVWVENSDGSGAVNFLTGMGGFLQVILFGFTGFRITRSGLLFDPAFPDGITKLKVSSISYLGNKLEVTITREEIRMEVTETSWDPPASPLEAVLESGQRFPLGEGMAALPASAPWNNLGRNHSHTHTKLFCCRAECLLPHSARMDPEVAQQAP
uniref:Protein-glucosylgalactosylhydroxylysine glucosidase n=1 Tax=Serinus canaria TaxID=9135 RepID=A0A8C9N0K0_SERCA